MNRSLIWLSVCCCLALPALAVAQAPVTSYPGANYRGAGNEIAFTSATPNMKQMYEDIEILRRLLNRDLLSHRLGQMNQCVKCHARPFNTWSLAFSPDGKMLAGQADGVVRLWDATTGKQVSAPHQEAHPFTGAEGAYLKGVGVIYTITLPPLPENPHAPPAKSTAKPLSDWERVRKQLQGEKVEAAMVPEQNEPSLSEVILKTLADNGRYFRHLGTTESLTVVVTFRGNEPAPAKTTGRNQTGTGTGPIGGQNPYYAPAGPNWYNEPTDKLTTGYPKPPRQSIYAQPGTTTTPPDNPSSARDYELLADLQLKQGRLDEAIAAYRRAVELTADAKGHVNLYRKLAQAHLMRAQDASALDAIAKGLQYLKKSQKETSTTATTSGLAAALPSQLLISIPQPRLHQIAAGAMTIEQFRQSAKVELRTFTEAQSKTTVEPKQ
jgi:hypothetical protein